MRSTTKLLSGLLVMIIAIGIGFAIGRTQRGGEPPPASEGVFSVRTAPPERAETSDQDIGALSQEVARLREEVAVLAAAHAARPADGDARALADLWRQVAALRDAGASEEPTSGPPPLEEVERDRQAQMEMLEASFHEERADPRWSGRASDAIQEALDRIDTDQLEVRSLECRSHTCRVELADDEAGRAATALPLFLLQVGETLPNATANQIEHSDGSRSTILYMTARANDVDG